MYGCTAMYVMSVCMYACTLSNIIWEHDEFPFQTHETEVKKTKKQKN